MNLNLIFQAKTSLNYLQSSSVNSNNTSVNAISKERIEYLKLKSEYEDLKNQIENKSVKSNSNDKENVSSQKSVEKDSTSNVSICKTFHLNILKFNLKYNFDII